MQLLFTKERNPIGNLQQASLYPALWMNKRRGYAEQNADKRYMSQHIGSEVWETAEQHHLLGTADFSPQEFDKEILDMFWMVFSLSYVNGLEFDFDDVARRANGQAAKGEIYPYLFSLAGDLDSKDFQKTSQEFMVWLWSLIKHLPYDMNLIGEIKEVSNKNEANHPFIYINGRNPKTAELLSPEESLAQAEHSRAALRLIRIATGNDTTGLKWQDHWPHRHLIFDFYNSHANLDQLASRLQIKSNS
jgi:hypothetical protein